MAAVCIDTIFLKLLFATVVSTSSSPDIGDFIREFLLFKLFGSRVTVTVGTINGASIGGGGGDALGGEAEAEDSDDDIDFSPPITYSSEFFLFSFFPVNSWFVE
jgi:hypothetical protein